mgnify:CR=1 FL=1
MSSLYGLLVQTSDANLTNGMRQLNEIYTRYYNRRNGLTDHLSQWRYNSMLVDQNDFLLGLSRYIDLNQVKTGMLKRVENWAWSSYKLMVGITSSSVWLSGELLLF